MFSFNPEVFLLHHCRRSLLWLRYLRRLIHLYLWILCIFNRSPSCRFCNGGTKHSRSQLEFCICRKIRSFPQCQIYQCNNQALSSLVSMDVSWNILELWFLLFMELSLLSSLLLFIFLQFLLSFLHLLLVLKRLLNCRLITRPFKISHPRHRIHHRHDS